MSGRARRLVLAATGSAALLAFPAAADQSSITVSDARAPSTASGGDAPVSMTVTNAGPADDLLRARCAPANFVEKHAVDNGEGFPSMRTVKSIPIAAEGVTRLGPQGFHVMLLQMSHALAKGDEFTCSMSFRAGGSLEVMVKVADPS